MRVISAMSVVMLSIVLVTGHAYSQSLKAGTLSGSIRSASATVPLGASGSLLLVPENRFYVMTQVCVEGALISGTLAGSAFGTVAGGGISRGCTVFTPGIVFQPGEEITFTVGAAPFPGPDLFF